MGIEEVIDYIPRKFSIDKHRRLYINAENVDRDYVKKVEKVVVKSFRVSVIDALKSKGYSLSKEVVENAEKLGPNPDILWTIFKDDKVVCVVIADSTFYTLDENSLKIFSETFSSYAKGQGCETIYATFTSLEKYLKSYLLRRVFYAKLNCEKLMLEAMRNA